jgi:hypothetical protein
MRRLLAVLLLATAACDDESDTNADESSTTAVVVDTSGEASGDTSSESSGGESSEDSSSGEPADLYVDVVAQYACNSGASYAILSVSAQFDEVRSPYCGTGAYQTTGELRIIVRDPPGVRTVTLSYDGGSTPDRVCEVDVTMEMLVAHDEIVC